MSKEKTNGQFLDNRLSPGKCDKCVKNKIITVKFGDERICKPCLDDISIEIGNRVAEELGVIDEPQSEETSEAEELPRLISTETESVEKDAKQVLKGKEKQGRPPKIQSVATFTQEEIDQMAAGGKQVDNIGQGLVVPSPVPGSQGGWR